MDAMPGDEIPQLPFELAALPHQLFGWLRLPVVSYALPALIAIGQVRHHHRPSLNPPLRFVPQFAEQQHADTCSVTFSRQRAAISKQLRSRVSS